MCRRRCAECSCMLEAVERGICLLEVPEVMRCVLLCLLEILKVLETLEV